MSIDAHDPAPIETSRRAAAQLLRGLLIAIAVTHIALGSALLLSRAAQVELAAWYGAHADFDVREVYLIRILGSCIVVIGTLAAAAVRRPTLQPALIIAIGEFFVLRNVQRHLFADELAAGFGVGGTVNVATTAVFSALVAGLWLSYRRAHRDI